MQLRTLFSNGQLKNGRKCRHYINQIFDQRQINIRINKAQIIVELRKIYNLKINQSMLSFPYNLQPHPDTQSDHFDQDSQSTQKDPYELYQFDNTKQQSMRNIKKQESAERVKIQNNSIQSEESRNESTQQFSSENTIPHKERIHEKTLIQRIRELNLKRQMTDVSQIKITDNLMKFKVDKKYLDISPSLNRNQMKSLIIHRQNQDNSSNYSNAPHNISNFLFQSSQDQNSSQFADTSISPTIKRNTKTNKKVNSSILFPKKEERGHTNNSSAYCNILQKLEDKIVSLPQIKSNKIISASSLHSFQTERSRLLYKPYIKCQTQVDYNDHLPIIIKRERPKNIHQSSHMLPNVHNVEDSYFFQKQNLGKSQLSSNIIDESSIETNRQQGHDDQSKQSRVLEYLSNRKKYRQNKHENRMSISTILPSISGQNSSFIKGDNCKRDILKRISQSALTEDKQLSQKEVLPNSSQFIDQSNIHNQYDDNEAQIPSSQKNISDQQDINEQKPQTIMKDSQINYSLPHMKSKLLFKITQILFQTILANNELIVNNSFYSLKLQPINFIMDILLFFLYQTHIQFI